MPPDPGLAAAAEAEAGADRSAHAADPAQLEALLEAQADLEHLGIVLPRPEAEAEAEIGR